MVLPKRLLLALVLCADACRPPAEDGEPAARRAEVAVAYAACTLAEVDRRYLRLTDGTFAYVEPQALLPAPGGFLLAGQPSYTSRVDDAGRGTIIDERRFFGLRVSGDDIVPVPQPEGVTRSAWVRGAAAEGAGWHFVFDEVEADAGVVADPVRIVYGELDADGRWARVEPLPTPSGASLASDGTGSPGAAGRGALEAAETASVQSAATASIRVGPSGPRLSIVQVWPTSLRDVLRLRRRESRWVSELLWPSWVDEAVLHRTDGREWLVIAGLAPELDAQLASLRVLELPPDGEPAPGPGGTPASTRHTVAPAGVRLRDVRAAGERRLDVGWLETAPEAPTSGWLLRSAGRAGAVIEPLSPNAALLTATSLSDTTTVWITHEPDGLGFAATSSLGFTVATPSGAFRAGAVPNPFHGPFAALAATPDTLWVVGPEATFGAVGSFVRSLVLRLTLSCT